MDLDGHRIYKINRNWVFDADTNCGYKVIFESGIVKDFMLAYEVVDIHGRNKYIKYLNEIPIGVLRKSVNVVKAHIDGDTIK